MPIPQIAKQYNEHMGGVDLHDQLLPYYRMSLCSKKYYMRLIFHLFDVINSWLMYRRDAESLGVPKKKQDSFAVQISARQLSSVSWKKESHVEEREAFICRECSHRAEKDWTCN